MTATASPIGFWNLAVEHSVDILNRTTGPPDSELSAYEHMTGERPRVLGILPFGCRCYAVKPRSAVSKTRLDARAWVGISLGRSSSSPGAYHVWLPDTSRHLLTSDVVFDEFLKLAES